MSELSIDLFWQRKSADLRACEYSNIHTIIYNDRLEIEADAAPDWGVNADNANPEQALAAARSSCHTMAFVALSVKAAWPVASYRDHAVAHLGRIARGQMSVTRTDLFPVVKFDPGFVVEPGKLEEMQRRAPHYCFISNTFADSVETNIH